MSMTIVLKTQLFRGDWDQARSQYALLWFMEAMCRVNQSHIRQFQNMAARGQGKEYPRAYKSGCHYERERGTEEWLDIPTILAGGSYPGEFPGAWDDCLPMDTLVLRNDFELVPIGSLSPGDKIMGDGEWTTVLDWMDKGEKPILSFELNNGAILRCTAEHKLFLQDGTEKKAGEIRVGDVLLTPTKNFPTNPEPMLDAQLSPEDLAWLIGVYTADGWHNLPRHPRFAISGKDGHPKEAQKRRVKEMMDALGVGTYWNERYIGVNDRRIAEIMAKCGTPAPNKNVPYIKNMDERQVKLLLEGLSADATLSSGQLTYGTTSKTLAMQIRMLYRMLGQSTHIKRWDDHGGLGKNPIYRVGVRQKPEDVLMEQHKRFGAKVVAIREDGEEHVCDIETDSKKFWLPESDLVVHNCEGWACWRVAELRELPWHWAAPARDPRTGKAFMAHIDSAYPPPPGAQRVPGGIKAKPFAKFKKRADGSYAYHALVLLPDGRLEDPSLTMGMTWEQEFHDRDIARKYQTGELPVQIRFTEIPDVVVVDPESPTGFSSNIDQAKRNAGFLPGGASRRGVVTNAEPSEIAAWGYNKREVRQKDMRELRNHVMGTFHSGRLGRQGRVGYPESNMLQRFGHIANAISIPTIERK
jgi:hypothetical protein